MRVVAGSDHGGLRLKTELIAKLREAGVEVEDVGTHDTASTDYPDYAAQVAERVLTDGVDWGLLVCGTGIGMSIAANKVTGIRAAVVSDVFSAEATRRHNDANVLCLGERVLGPGLAWKIVETFMTAPFDGGRHQRRIDKMTALESER